MNKHVRLALPGADVTMNSVRTEFERSTHFLRPMQVIDRADFSTRPNPRAIYLCSDDGRIVAPKPPDGR
jgi:hypothetical protein